jgi:hypothetical protein
MANKKNNGPDSLTNYIKGRGEKVRRFAAGGMTNDDDKYTRLDSINVQNIRNMKDVFPNLNPKSIGGQQIIDNLKKYDKKEKEMGDVNVELTNMEDILNKSGALDEDFYKHSKKHGGIIDNPDSLTNYIKGRNN